MKKWNWAIIGQGAIAHQLAEALMKEHGEIYAVAGRNEEKVKAFASQYRVSCLHTMQSVYEDENVDIIYIATPHTFHYENMMDALRVGKHVLCEKAITVNDTQLKEVCALAKEKNLVVMEAMTIFNMPIYEKAKEIIESGKIGKVKMIQVNFGSCKEYDVTNRFFAKELAGGALLDIGTYAMSFVRYFMREKPDALLTQMIPFETGVDEMSGIVLKNQYDEMATITLTMRAKLPKRGIIAGEEGYIEIMEYPRADKLVLRMTATGEETIIEAGKREDALLYEVQNMEKIINKEKENVSLAWSMEVIALLSEVRRQWNMKYPFE